MTIIYDHFILPSITPHPFIEIGAIAFLIPRFCISEENE